MCNLWDILGYTHVLVFLVAFLHIFLGIRRILRRALCKERSVSNCTKGALMKESGGGGGRTELSDNKRVSRAILTGILTTDFVDLKNLKNAR